jgi:hypothetical protein
MNDINKIFSRKATLSDLFDTTFDDKPNQKPYIEKNQKHYGERKRIKP